VQRKSARAPEQVKFVTAPATPAALVVHLRFARSQGQGVKLHWSSTIFATTLISLFASW